MSDPETLTWLFVVIGLILRLLEYADSRPLYMDEAALFRNLVGRPVFDFTTRLTENQLAPPAFLVLERAIVRLPSHRVWAARLVPLASGIASLFLMRAVARRYLSVRAVPIAVGLFALDDWLLYYSAEIKQYSTDVMLTLVALLLGSVLAATSRRRLFGLAVFGVVGVWFSHPLAFVLAALGTYLAGEAAVRHEWKRVWTYMGMSVLWAISFAICYVVSRGILTKDRFIWDWWYFAFLPIPPCSLADLGTIFWHVLNIFNNPSWVVTPLGVIASAFVALALFVIGAISLGMRWRGGVYLLLAPILFAIVASALHQYPFHGRLLLFLVPAVHLLVAEGAATLGRPCGVVLAVAIGIFLLAQPTVDVFWHRVIAKRHHGSYDSHGDLLPDVLDHLEIHKIDNPTLRWRQ